jgi:hypothetical protein
MQVYRDEIYDLLRPLTPQEKLDNIRAAVQVRIHTCYAYIHFFLRGLTTSCLKIAVQLYIAYVF